MNYIIHRLNFPAWMILQIVPASSIPDGWMGLDIGPDSIKTFSEVLDTTKTIIWNGPMGVFEFDKFAAGTEVWHNSLYFSFKHTANLCLKNSLVLYSTLLMGFEAARICYIVTYDFFWTFGTECLYHSLTGYCKEIGRS